MPRHNQRPPPHRSQPDAIAPLSLIGKRLQLFNPLDGYAMSPSWIVRRYLDGFVYVRSTRTGEDSVTPWPELRYQILAGFLRVEES